MQKFTTTWISDETGPKVFYGDSKRLQIHESSMMNLSKFAKSIEYKYDVPGIYILLGDTDKGKTVYIGEADNIKNRLGFHKSNPKKDFAERIAIITSKDVQNPYKKSELHYIEKELIRKFASTYEIANGNSGQGRIPTPIERMALDEEVSHIHLGLTSLGIVLEDNTTNSTSKQDYESEGLGDIEIYITIPNTKVKVPAIVNSDLSATTFKKGTKFTSMARQSVHNRKIVSKALNDSRINPSIKVDGDIDGYTIEYLDDVHYKYLSTAGYLIKGGAPGTFSVWKIKSTDEPIDSLRKDI